MNETLNPCPFCGGSDLQYFHELTMPAVQFVYCCGCEMHGPEATTLDGATAAWNRRAPSSHGQPSRGEPPHCCGDALKYHTSDEPQDWHVTQLKKRLSAPHGRDVERLYDAGYLLLRQIRDYERQTGRDLPPDHACVRCRPNSEMLVEGFLCGRHAMSTALRSRQEPEPVALGFAVLDDEGQIYRHLATEALAREWAKETDMVPVAFVPLPASPVAPREPEK